MPLILYFLQQKYYDNTPLKPHKDYEGFMQAEESW